MLRIFIGYDDREVVAYHTLCHSILTRATVPISFIPLSRALLSSIFKPNHDVLASTAFSHSRFLVPYLSAYEGTSLYMDSDIVVTQDIKTLFDMFDSTKTVQVVKHNYTPKTSHKFLNQVQTVYDKKNWSSVMLFNNQRCRILSPKHIEKSSGLYLHQFNWLEDETLIGELPTTWNFLVDEYPESEPLPAALHYTLGGPYFKDYVDCDYAAVWLAEYQALSKPLID